MQEKRDRCIYFKLSKTEFELIKQKKALAGIRNTSAYLRKMAIDGYTVKLEIEELGEVSRLLRITSNNVNQMAKRANEKGSIYETDIVDVKNQLNAIKSEFGKMLKSLSVLK